MLIDLIDAVLHHGFTWLTVIAIVNLYFKDRRRKREHKKMDRIIELLEGMACVSSTASKHSVPKCKGCSVSSIRTFARFVQGKKVYRYITKFNLRRVSKMKSRKLWMAIISAVLVVLNEGLDLGVDSNTVMAFAGIVISYILGQAHVDAKTQGGTNAQYTDTSGPTK